MDLTDVCLAIAAFKSDKAVGRLLEEVFEQGNPFGDVLVVESEGTGKLRHLLERRGWSARYFGHSENLGSAGNLAERLRQAGKGPAKYALTLNHDGCLNVMTAKRLLRAAKADPAIGAAYPLLRFSAGGGLHELTGTQRVPIRPLRSRTPPSDEVVATYWGSSNGALYNLEPVRRGILPYADLWMGWEDLGYGWQLLQNNYRQVLVAGSVLEDNYEFKNVGRGVWISEKPDWGAYYYSRNLIAAAWRTRQPMWVRAAVIGRIGAEGVITALARRDKLRRLGYLATGCTHAVLGKMGKWRVP